MDVCAHASTCVLQHAGSWLRMVVYSCKGLSVMPAGCVSKYGSVLKPSVHITIPFACLTVVFVNACMCICSQDSFLAALLGVRVGLRGIPDYASLGGAQTLGGARLVFLYGVGAGTRIRSHCLGKPGTWSWKRIRASQIPEEQGFPVWAQLRPNGGREGKAGQGDPLVLNHGCCRGDR